ncbi:UDP-glycosyltransferase 84B2-like [Senna tora]|uniref:Glycosyltransferase n=1 Tax=Senna tora TaxID=362788 RepID=A0A834TUT2_9FABA|nr:UDP-glycosyltransferase 84B2-like [Senna tora]
MKVVGGIRVSLGSHGSGQWSHRQKYWSEAFIRGPAHSTVRLAMGKQKMAQEKAKVLMVSMALQGHLNPMLKFAKRLISKGVHVTLATNDVARHRMLKHNNNTPSPNHQEDSQTPSIQLEYFSDGLSVDFDRDGDTGTFVNSISTIGSKNLSALISTLSQTHHYSCVIINPFVPWAVDVAHQHGIPCAVLWIQACALYSIYYRYFKNIDAFPDLEDPNQILTLPGLPNLEVRDLPSFMLPSSPPHFKKLLLRFFEALEKVKWILGASFYEIEEEIVKSMAPLAPIHPIGPLVSPCLLGQNDDVANATSVDMWNAEDSCMEWLDKREARSVVYISFGSIVILSREEMENMARALRKSEKPFLWVVKKAENGGGEGEEEEITAGGRGLVVRWCEQEKVLMHPAVGCFVTHCGWNSTVETVVAGVPVIGYPKWTDQATNAKLARDVFKNGVQVKYGEDKVASSEEVVRCIREVMEGSKAEEMRKRAMELKEAAKKALQEAGSSDSNINAFIADLIN